MFGNVAKPCSGTWQWLVRERGNGLFVYRNYIEYCIEYCIEYKYKGDEKKKKRIPRRDGGKGWVRKGMRMMRWGNMDRDGWILILDRKEMM